MMRLQQVGRVSMTDAIERRRNRSLSAEPESPRRDIGTGLHRVYFVVGNCETNKGSRYCMLDNCRPKRIRDPKTTCPMHCDSVPPAHPALFPIPFLGEDSARTRVHRPALPRTEPRLEADRLGGRERFGHEPTGRCHLSTSGCN
jgi:hypothetical protein